MIFITFINDKIKKNDNTKLFEKSIYDKNQKIIYLNIFDFDQNEEKIKKLIEYLKNNTKSNEIICYFNIYNTFFNKNIDELESKFIQLQTNKILFSTKFSENNELNLQDVFEIDTTFIGYSEKIINFFELICEKYNCKYHNTNILVKEYLNICDNCIEIDNDSNIFFNLNEYNINNVNIYKNNISYKNKIPIIITYHINQNLLNYLNNLLEKINLPKIQNYYQTKVHSEKTGKIIYNILKYTHFLIVLILYFSVFFTNNLYYLIFLFCINLLVFIQWKLLNGCFWTKLENYYEKLFYIDYKFKDTDLERSNIKRMLKNYFNISFETSEFVMNRLPLTVCVICLIKIYIYHIKK